MIKTYYKFALDKELLIKTEQDIVGSENTCITGIYVDNPSPDLSDSTVKCQDGGFIPRGLPESTWEWVEWEVTKPSQSLDWFLIEKLRSESLQWEYYEKFYIW